MAAGHPASPSFIEDDDSADLFLDSHSSPAAWDQQQDPFSSTAASTVDSKHLSPYLSNETISPSNSQLGTPAGSNVTAGAYQSSDFSELDEDPFFGADFNQLNEATPSFLDAQSEWNRNTSFAYQHTNTNNAPETTRQAPLRNAQGESTYPLTPGPTSTTFTSSPRSDRQARLTRPIDTRIPFSISPQELQKPFKSGNPVAEVVSQLTPSQSGSGRSSEDGLTASQNAMAFSPRVTVSVWDKDEDGLAQVTEGRFGGSPTTVRGTADMAGELISSTYGNQSTASATELPNGRPVEEGPNRNGLDPGQRPTEEGPSLNETAARHKVEERNQEVGKWLSDGLVASPSPKETSTAEIQAIEKSARESNDGIPLGDTTENRYEPGQTYFEGNGGEMSLEDHNIILADRNWAAGPVLHPITKAYASRHQPQSSQDAIARFEQLYRDNDSIISRSATWGTRRRSITGLTELDLEGVTSGNFLKKLSISRSGGGNNQSGSLLKDLRGLMRRPSASKLLKRTHSSNSNQGDPARQEDIGESLGKRDSGPHLLSPERSTSWGKKGTPSINTALISMAHGAASIGATHARSGSISGGTPAHSPRSPRNSLSVIDSLRRPRSKSELPKSNVNPIGGIASGAESHPNLIGMLARSGGPPVPNLSRASLEQDEDDDDDDDLYEDGDLRKDANLIDIVTPNFSGFQDHVGILNPGLVQTNAYLVDRIAHQQIIRYKQLLNAKVKHLGQGTKCPSGPLCVAQGGTANILDHKGDIRSLDPLSTHYDEGEDGSPIEGAINHESFPQDIPMPPAGHLPAEFECQLCFQRKKFQKPSDWTKHVHEDVQPFTCTWEKCREPKIFKRKADWVRHENEGHRHLEWWTCDVEDCRHVCYRRDNFLQHLVREHKFTEPKIKTKAAMKKAGGGDPTWQKVERCHVETHVRPQEEPCKFCGKQFPSWKKLTVHLAKHMEQITLPVLRLVAVKAKELDADTIISPVQDPPPRHSLIFPTGPDAAVGAFPYHHQQPGQQQHQQQQHQQEFHPNGQHNYMQNQDAYMYPIMPEGGQYPQSYFTPQMNNVGSHLQQSPMPMNGFARGFEDMQQQQQHQQQQQQHTAVHSDDGNYIQGSTNYMNMVEHPSNVGQFQQLNALGLQNIPISSMPMLYDDGGMVDPSSTNGSPFSGRESLTPHGPSPHVQNGAQQQSWDGQALPRYM